MSASSTSGSGPVGMAFLTITEVAAELRLSKMSVYRFIHDGKLEAIQVGRSFRVTRKALDEFIANSFYNAG